MAYLANLIFENCHFHSVFRNHITAIVVNSNKDLTLMTIGDHMEGYI